MGFAIPWVLMGGSVTKLRGRRDPRIAPTGYEEEDLAPVSVSNRSLTPHPHAARAWTLADANWSAPTALLASSHTPARARTFETSREAAHSSRSVERIKRSALLWEKAATGAGAGPSAREAVAKQLSAAVDDLLPLLDASSRKLVEAWAARSASTDTGRAPGLRGRALGNAIRAAQRVAKGSLSKPEKESTETCAVDLLGPLQKAVQSFKEQEPATVQHRVHVPAPLQEAKASATFSMGAAAPQPEGKVATSSSARLLAHRGERLVVSPGEVGGHPVTVEDCDGCVVMVTDVASQVLLSRCRDCHILLGAVEGDVFVRQCSRCVLRVACGQLQTKDCTECDFLVWTSSSPLTETSTYLRFGFWDTSQSEDYEEHSSQLQCSGLAELDAKVLEVVNLSPSVNPHVQHFSMLSMEEAEKLLLATGAAQPSVTPRAQVTSTGSHPPVASSSSACARARVRLEPLNSAPKGGQSDVGRSPSKTWSTGSAARRERRDARIAEGPAGILRGLMKQMKLQVKGAVDMTGPLTMRSAQDIAAPHLKRVASKLGKLVSQDRLAMLSESFLEGALEIGSLAQRASTLTRALHPATYGAAASFVAHLDSRTTWSANRACLNPAALEECVANLLKQDVAKLQLRLLADAHSRTTRLLSAAVDDIRRPSKAMKERLAETFVEDLPSHEELRALYRAFRDSSTVPDLPSKSLNQVDPSLPPILCGRAAASVCNRLAADKLFSASWQQALQAHEENGSLQPEDVKAIVQEVGRCVPEAKDARITFGQFSDARRTLKTHRGCNCIDSHMSASTFMCLHRDMEGRVLVDSLIDYTVRRANLQQSFVHISSFDRCGRGKLREADIEDFVADFAANTPDIGRKLERDFFPFYVMHASRCLMFHLDHRKAGRVAVTELVCSPLLSELHELQQSGTCSKRCAKNRFAIETAKKYHADYCKLDSDGDGMLSDTDLLRFGSKMLSPLFLKVLVQEVSTERGLLDFKNFLDFMFAYTEPQSASAIKYFWRALGTCGRNAVPASFFRPFVTSILKILDDAGVFGGYGYLDPNIVIDELLDMVDCRCWDDGERLLRLSDLLASKLGGTFVQALVDGLAFWRYDNRESLAHEDDEDDEENS